MPKMMKTTRRAAPCKAVTRFAENAVIESRIVTTARRILTGDSASTIH